MIDSQLFIFNKQYSLFSINLQQLMSHLHPAVGELFDFQLDECFKISEPNDPINMSSMIQCVTGEQTLKLKSMKNKMSIFELKDLVTQLLEMIREQNICIKRHLNTYKYFVRDCTKKLVEKVEKKWVLFKTLQEEIFELKESEDKWMRELKNLKLEIQLLEDKKRENDKKDEEIQRLKVSINKEKQISQKKIEAIKKQSYKTYQQNFDLQQKISSLEDEINQQKQEFTELNNTQIKQIQKLNQHIINLNKINESLKLQIANKDIKIVTLENKLNQVETKNQINNVNVNIQSKNVKLTQRYHLNLSNINTQVKSKHEEKQYSVERSIKSAKRSQKHIKLSNETIQFMKAKSNLETSKISDPSSIESNPLSPYVIKNIKDNISQRVKSRSREHNLITSRRLDSKDKPVRQRFDFNRIQLEIDKLKDRLESDLSRSRKVNI